MSDKHTGPYVPEALYSCPNLQHQKWPSGHLHWNADKGEWVCPECPDYWAHEPTKPLTLADHLKSLEPRQPSMQHGQALVDSIVARAKELGATDGLTHKGKCQFNMKQSSGIGYQDKIAHALVGGLRDKYDLIWMVQALIEHLQGRWVPVSERLPKFGEDGFWPGFVIFSGKIASGLHRNHFNLRILTHWLDFTPPPLPGDEEKP